jgi:hypothetical protein
VNITLPFLALLIRVEESVRRAGIEDDLVRPSPNSARIGAESS